MTEERKGRVFTVGQKPDGSIGVTNVAAVNEAILAEVARTQEGYAASSPLMHIETSDPAIGKSHAVQRLSGTFHDKAVRSEIVANIRRPSMMDVIEHELGKAPTAKDKGPGSKK